MFYVATQRTYCPGRDQPPQGFEPWTCALRKHRSTAELRWLILPAIPAGTYQTIGALGAAGTPRRAFRLPASDRFEPATPGSSLCRRAVCRFVRRCSSRVSARFPPHCSIACHPSRSTNPGDLRDGQTIREVRLGGSRGEVDPGVGYSFQPTQHTLQLRRARLADHAFDREAEHGTCMGVPRLAGLVADHRGHLLRESAAGRTWTRRRGNHP